MVKRVLGILVAAAAVVLLALWPRAERVDRAARPSGPSAARPEARAHEAARAVEPPPGAEPGGMLVEVVDINDDNPVGNVDPVLRRGLAAIDDAFAERDGVWEAAGLAPGTYVLTVGALHYGPETIEVPVPAGECVRVRVELERNPAIHGLVTDKSGAPLAGILVSFGWSASKEMHATWTASNGAFHIGWISNNGPDWSGTLAVRDPRGVYARTQLHLESPFGDDVHRVVLARAACVTGRLVPRPGDQVRYHLTYHDGATASTLKVRPDGSFVLGDVKIGQITYLTLVLADKAPIVRGPFRLEKGEQKDLGDLPVGPGRSLSFAVRSTNGTPIQNLSVLILLPCLSTRGFFEPRIVGFASDVAHLDLLPDGPILLRIAARGLAPRWIRIDDVAAFAPNEIALDPAGVLVVTVVDADGAPVSDAVVVRDDERPTFEQDVSMVDDVKLPPTDAQGHVRVDLAPGHYYLQLDGERGRIAEIRGGETTRVELRLRRPPR